jgi:hypothetical protein
LTNTSLRAEPDKNKSAALAKALVKGLEVKLGALVIPFGD